MSIEQVARGGVAPRYVRPLLTFEYGNMRVIRGKAVDGEGMGLGED